MTREQVHDLMENELRCVQRGNYCDRDCAKCPLVKDDKELIEAYGYVIKALEQEPVLDKIRVEIEQEQDDFMDDKDYDEGVRFGLMLAYQIIDKYKAESEDKE